MACESIRFLSGHYLSDTLTSLPIPFPIASYSRLSPSGLWGSLQGATFAPWTTAFWEVNSSVAKHARGKCSSLLRLADEVRTLHLSYLDRWHDKLSKSVAVLPHWWVLVDDIKNFQFSIRFGHLIESHTVRSSLRPIVGIAGLRDGNRN